MYQVLLAQSARKFYEKADSPLQRKLDRCFDALRGNPRHHPNVKPLKGQLSGSYRYRVGEYRVVYRVEDGKRLVIVVIIAHRREAYDR
ncbi:MAG TPA: type II toxin-antitoxin system RelE/ParE family toxin [Thermoanaerobaculia bacterium]|nr:type II toxin-antitoxin system RelE/ParE family toxin [Thermoanaerobaculia bacterium]